MSGELALKTIDEKSGMLRELAVRIWENPEIAYREEKACRWTAETLEKEGFKVERGYAGVATALRAVWGSGGPVVGFLGEYDALPNLSQKVSTTREAAAEGTPGHGCGHNLICAAHLGAAIAVKKELEEKKLAGTVVFYGCPAEEVLTGKVFMARGGAFKELDIVFAWHPGTRNMISTGALTAMNSVKFHFQGVTAHAGGDPQNGRSALDAAELMNVGANFLREHVTDDIRIHYAFSEVHGAPNVVPDKTSVWYFVRALSRGAVEDTYKRLIKVAEGAAIMTETSVNVEFLGGCYNTLQNGPLLDLVYAVMKEVPLPQWTAEEELFAKKLDMDSPIYEKMAESGAIAAGVHLDSAVAPVDTRNNYGSTDVGDVQNIVPGVFFMTASSNIGAPGHSWNTTACSGHSIGMKGMLYGAKVMAVAALKAIAEPSVIKMAKADFEKSIGNKPYKCPISDEVSIPH